MRTDRIAPLTWLLLIAAVWALLGAVLAWAGMGSRIAGTIHLEAPPVPRPIVEAKDAVSATYDAFVSRPLFAPDRRPHPFSLTGGGDANTGNDAPRFEFALTSVIITPRLRLAIVEPSGGGESVRVREGESADGLSGWRLVEVRPRAAVFEGAGGRIELGLRIWGGGDNVAFASQAMPSPNAGTPPQVRPDSVSGAIDRTTEVQNQTDAIRRRIAARRARLRQESQQTQARPARNP